MRPLALAALLMPALAAAADPGDPIRAVRLTEPIVLDGRLEEADWDRVKPYDGFVQMFPAEGKPPSERTEVRVLYDDRTLYVGVLCRHADPSRIVRPLGRRDKIPYSDEIDVFVDSMHDRRTAYTFSLNAAGVQADSLTYGEDETSMDWDAIWDGAVAEVPGGWSAEFAIPLAVLRFSDKPVQEWGIALRRVVAATHEELVSIPLKRSDRGVVARFQPLQGLIDLKPVVDFGIAPYLASRVAWRPKFTDTTMPRPRLTDPSADLGLDLRTSLGHGLILQGTLNPDFGQVEADQIIRNLTTFEVQFPEKRPFFMQGMDLFQPIGVGDSFRPPQQLFYSRRIGLDAPILAAAKLTGRVHDDIQIGLVEAFVDGAGPPAGSTEADPVRSYRFTPHQPLHFGSAGSYPQLTPASRNVLAGVARWQPVPVAAIGITATSALPVGAACTPADAALDDDHRPPRCDVGLGNAVALDWNAHTVDNEWFVNGQLGGSQYLGGGTAHLLGDGTVLASGAVLADGTVMRRGDLGLGGYLSAGRQGGEPFRFDVHYGYQSPRLDLNAVGYQPAQNRQELKALVHWVRPAGGGPWLSYGVHLGGLARLSTDGRGHDLGRVLFLNFDAQHASFNSGGCNLEYDTQQTDLREISQRGVGLQMAGGFGGNCWVSTDRSKVVSLDGGVGFGRQFALGGLPPAKGWGLGTTLTVRPHSRLETSLAVSYDDSIWAARWVDQDASGTLWFAGLHAPSISLTLRQQLVLTPRLTLQAYAQLFTANGRYGPYYSAQAQPGQVVKAADLVPGQPVGGGLIADPDWRDVALNVNVVLRWEYRLGSTLYLVYTRSQAEPGLATGDVALPGLAPRGLALGPTTDTALVKWTWWWSG